MSFHIFIGATGSGKTTQVPQYILDYHREQKKYCNILVTQPRRIAAQSIAKRVSDERKWPLGNLVGYQVGRDKKVTEDTRITYVTTGVLRQKLIMNKSMNEYTHIILDEVRKWFPSLIILFMTKTACEYICHSYQCLCPLCWAKYQPEEHFSNIKSTVWMNGWWIWKFAFGNLYLIDGIFFQK